MKSWRPPRDSSGVCGCRSARPSAAAWKSTSGRSATGGAPARRCAPSPRSWALRRPPPRTRPRKRPRSSQAEPEAPKGAARRPFSFTAGQPALWCILRFVARENFRGLVLTSVAVCGAAAAGCGSLAVKKIAAVSQSPANVALYVDVHDGSGNAAPNLQEKDFRIYEDGKLLPAGKAKRALLEPKGLGARFVMV